MIINNEAFKKDRVYRVTCHAPYDGCFYEPVYAYASEDGKADFLCYGDEKDWSSRMVDAVEQAWVELEDLTAFDSNDLTILFNANPEHAVSVAKTIFKRHGVLSEIKCPNCEQMKPADEFEYDEGSTQGLGGIAYTYTDWYCTECIINNRCDYCGCLVLGTDDELDEDGRCADCRQQECKFCGDYGDPLKFDEHGVCEDCQEDEEYIKQLEEYQQKVREIKYRNEHQLRFEGISEETIPEFNVINRDSLSEVSLK